MQSDRKSIKGFFRSKYVQALTCYSLPSCAFYFGAMLAFRRAIEADIYLALNLVVPADADMVHSACDTVLHYCV